MAIQRTLIAQTVVLVTNNINTGVFSQYWFIQNKIFQPEEIMQDSVFAPGVSIVSAPDCQIICEPSRIQIAIKSDNPSEAYSCVKNRLAKMVSVVQMLPVIAIGVNFIWKVQDSERDVHTLSSYLFGENDSEIYGYFNKPDSRMGAYFSQDIDDNTRLKLDIKPVHTFENNSKIEFITASFNYHRDLQIDKSAQQIDDQLKKWSNLRQNSNKVVCLLR